MTAAQFRLAPDRRAVLQLAGVLPQEIERDLDGRVMLGLAALVKITEMVDLPGMMEQFCAAFGTE